MVLLFPDGDADGDGADGDGDVVDGNVVSDGTHPWHLYTCHPGHRHSSLSLFQGFFAVIAKPRVSGSAYVSGNTEN